VPSIYDIKPAFQRILRPLTRLLANAGVTANQVTVVAVALSCGVGTCVAVWPSERWPLLVMPAFLFVRMALNAIDGMLAREHDMKSNLGAILNEVGDVVADTALFLPLSVVPRFNPYLVVLCTILAAISEMTGVVAVQIGATRRYDGPMGKSDRAFAFGLLALLAGLGVPMAPWVSYALSLIAVLLVWTIINRSRKALAETRTKA
jgi:CDP-diacylglycerol---glycerol-3-phosphate 3-phosphatidyltransferase